MGVGIQGRHGGTENQLKALNFEVIFDQQKLSVYGYVSCNGIYYIRCVYVCQTTHGYKKGMGNPRLFCRINKMILPCIWFLLRYICRLNLFFIFGKIVILNYKIILWKMQTHIHRHSLILNILLSQFLFKHFS